MELRPSHPPLAAPHATPAHRVGPRRGVAGVLAAASLVVAAVALESVLGIGGTGVEEFFAAWVYDGVLVLAAALCLARAGVQRAERAIWVFFGSGLAVWAAGDIYFSFLLDDGNRFPSLADALWLAFYPLTYVGLGLLVRARVASFSASVWLDGVIGALGVAAIGAAVVFGTVLDATGGSAVAVATNLAYPLADLLLLAIMVATLALTGARLDGTWRLLSLGFVVFAVSDSIYLFEVASGTYEYGPLDVGWLIAAILVAAAAWQPVGRRSRARPVGTPILALPAAFAVSSLAIIVYDRFHATSALATILAAGALGAVILRMVLSVHENLRLAEASRREAHTDEVTGLANRRQLLTDLESAVRHPQAHQQVVLTLFDLNGFKRYNDTHGHLAGDELLKRLAGRLDAAARPHGRAYRLGGDEFCTLVHVDDSASTLPGRLLAALAEYGDRFAVNAAHGSVLLPGDASDPAEALRLADARMYRQKQGARLVA
jgi:two-component system cell cycle response regulator